MPPVGWRWNRHSVKTRLTIHKAREIVSCRPPCAKNRQEDVAVKLNPRYLFAAAAGLTLTLPLLGQEPNRLQVDKGQALTPRLDASANQRIANTIAENLRQSGQLRHYGIEVVYLDGTAQLAGTVADQPQREEVLRIVQGVPGVERVLDHMTLAGAVTRVQAQNPPMQEIAPPHAVGGPQGVVEPQPMYQAPMPSPYDLNPPKMPPYAWPTYAPYNNYSRVAYPEAYPYQAWPFIGPCYPFPKVPLGWRSVKLTWEDGHWWYSKVATPHDWWRIRYW
jgi:hypothetical protein